MLTRWQALEIIAAVHVRNPIVVTLGATARELAAVARGDNHLYILDSMGLPPAIGLGLAMGLSESRIECCVVIEGDGSLLMGLSTLATIGLVKPIKLLLIVLDNRVYAATGGQATASTAVDLVTLATSCGLGARRADGADELAAILEDLRNQSGPHFLYVPITPDNAQTPLLLEDPVLLAARFRQFIDDNK